MSRSAAGHRRAACEATGLSVSASRFSRSYVAALPEPAPTAQPLPLDAPWSGGPLLRLAPDVLAVPGEDGVHAHAADRAHQHPGRNTSWWGGVPLAKCGQSRLLQPVGLLLGASMLLAPDSLVGGMLTFSPGVARAGVEQLYP